MSTEYIKKAKPTIVLKKGRTVPGGEKKKVFVKLLCFTSQKCQTVENKRLKRQFSAQYDALG